MKRKLKTKPHVERERHLELCDDDRDAKHVVLGESSFRCLHCGDEYKVNMPCPISVFSAAAIAYAEEHQSCKPSQRGEDRFKCSTPTEWWNSWDTGASSKTIWRFMVHGATISPSIPHDPADFGRCYRLLKAFPRWRDRMDDMGRAIPAWLPFAGVWSELEQLFEAGNSPTLYQRIRSLVSLSEQAVRASRGGDS